MCPSICIQPWIQLPRYVTSYDNYEVTGILNILKLTWYKSGLVSTYVDHYHLVCIHKHMNLDVSKFLLSNSVFFSNQYLLIESQ